MENVNIPVTFWEKYIAPLFEKPAEVREVVKEPEDYSALKTENAKYKAEIEKQQAEVARKARVEKYDSSLKETKADPTLAELLADLPEEKAEAVMKQFRALSEQIKESNLTTEQGTPAEGTDEDPQAAFNAKVLAISAEKHINYTDAFEVAKVSHPDLFKAGWGRK